MAPNFFNFAYFLIKIFKFGPAVDSFFSINECTTEMGKPDSGYWLVAQDLIQARRIVVIMLQEMHF